MALVEVRERERIARFCRRRPGVHAYLLGDLDDFFWPHTRWLGWEEDGVLTELALLYTEPERPVLLAFQETSERTLSALLAAAEPQVPQRLYAHVTGPCLEQLLATRAVGSVHPHSKLALVDEAALARHDPGEQPEILGPTGLAEVEAFYRVAYPGTWFHPRLLETRRYIGIREGRELVAVAGVHVYSPEWRVATLGNVATLPHARGRGLALRACAQLCRLLVADGIDTIGLNVRDDNAAALRVYRALGFVEVARYVEALLDPT
ncbi:MAG: GNAT family N-acetyltransferase [Thermoleophilia bacterium]|nr:GNAT family N-acetyltransferase [Thermoleophilia bacterium]